MKRRAIIDLTTEQIVIVVVIIAAFLGLLYVTMQITGGTLSVQ